MSDDWRAHLVSGLEIGAELVSGLDRAELDDAAQEELAEAQSLLSDTIEKLSRTTDAGERKRLHSRLVMLRETIRQSALLDQIVTAQALRSTAAAVTDIALRSCLEIAAEVIGEA